MARLSSSLLLLLMAASAVMIIAATPKAEARRDKSHRFSLHHQNFVGSRTNTPAMAIGSTIRAIDLKAKVARAYSLKLAARAKDKMTRANLNDCAEMYSLMSFNLAKTLANLKARDSRVSVNLSAVLDFLETCDDGFVDNGNKSPLAAHNDVMRKMASNGLALAARLH